MKPGGVNRGVPDMKSRYASSSAGRMPKAGSSKAKAQSDWDSDDEAEFSKYKQKNYQRFAFNRREGKNPFGGGGGKESSSEEESFKGGGGTYGAGSKPVGQNNGGEGCHYHTLGIDSTSDERQIKIAYRKLALKFHPDKNKEPGAEEKFKTVTSAYSVIIDKTTRTAYDRSRKAMNYVKKAW